MNVGLYKWYGWSLVLIDTWWNVNDTKPSFSSKVDNVLIDTWWNVNQRTGGSFRG